MSLRILFCALLSLLLLACSESGRSSAGSELMSAPAPAMAEAGASSDTFSRQSAPVTPPAASVGAGISQRVIIRNASLTLLVKDAEAELKPLADIAARFGGFVSQSGFNRGDTGATNGTVQLRVDATRLDDALQAIRSLAIEVRDLNISSEDVTGQVVDVEARLRNLRSAEQQLLEIMQQAKKTEEVMSVFGQLTQTRGEIEQATAQLKYLRESAALSTVTLSLMADSASQAVQVAGWRPVGAAKRAIEQLVSALQGLADLAIWAVIVVLPIILLIGLPLRWLLRRRKQRRAD